MEGKCIALGEYLALERGKGHHGFSDRPEMVYPGFIRLFEDNCRISYRLFELVAMD
jgi:hypothetical protein